MPDDPSTSTAPERVSQVFAELRAGRRHAADDLLPIVYDELRELARARFARLPPGQTLQATALVNEAYIRVVGGADPGWDNLGHLFAAFAQAIRNIIVDKIRSRGRLRRGGEWNRIHLDSDLLADDAPGADERLLALDAAIARLEQVDERKARIVTLRFFTGRSMADIARMIGVSTRTVERDWEFARVWLHRELGASGAAGPDEPSDPKVA